jgi:hypothetical protein
MKHNNVLARTMLVCLAQFWWDVERDRNCVIGEAVDGNDVQRIDSEPLTSGASSEGCRLYAMAGKQGQLCLSHVGAGKSMREVLLELPHGALQVRKGAATGGSPGGEHLLDVCDHQRVLDLNLVRPLVGFCDHLF